MRAGSGRRGVTRPSRPMPRTWRSGSGESLRRAVAEARAGRTDKVQALKRLAAFSPAGSAGDDQAAAPVDDRGLW